MRYAAFWCAMSISCARILGILVAMAGCAAPLQAPTNNLAELQGAYVVGPQPCEGATTKFVIISNSKFVDHTGNIRPSEFAIDRVEKGTFEYSAGSEAGSRGLIYYAYTFEADGSLAISAFSEIQPTDFIELKRQFGYGADPIPSATSDRSAFLFTRANFEEAPTIDQINEWLQYVPDSDYQVLERCP